ncbi:MAG: hypothetical protein MJ184_01030 [Treponema sp.]|uniref:hypothetical protein n=1 Tax=Treponema sp. TaxID=166 RepID=UPI00298DFFAB|nr:hypothetical protein [Treponema sp.]MCQ2599927.1 hypothetical protein [Treponema sp.]
MLIIKKICCSMIFIFVAHMSIFSKSFVTQFGLRGNAPVMSKCKCEKINDGIIIQDEGYELSADIDENNKYVFNLSSDIKTLKYQSKIDNQKISSMFNLTLEKNIPCILICYNVDEATGVGANISYGTLIEFRNGTFNIIELSTFGDITDSFMDINNDGIFEFICIDLSYDNENAYLIPNVFVLNGVVKNITDVTKVFSICLDCEIIKRLNQLDYTLLKNPDVWRK